MIKEIKLPEVSDNVETGDVLKVLVKVGDQIEVDTPLVELETEKATFEVPSTDSGVVKEINVKEGDTIKIGAIILTLESNGKGEQKDEKKEAKSDEGKDQKSDNKDEKKDQENDEEKEQETEDKDQEKSKEKIEKTDKEKEEKTDKVKDQKSDGKKEEKTDDEKDQKSDDKTEEKKDTDDKKRVETTKSSMPASPSVRRLARELGVDINSLTVSGESGRATEDDIKNYVKGRLNSGSPATSLNQKSLPDFKKWGEVEIESMTKVRSITAESMTYAWTTIPMVTQFDKADITQLEEFRKKNLKKVETAGGNLTITSILVKVCEAALRAFPQFNASIDLQKNEIIYKKYFNIGVAVDTDRGLLVPVIKDVNKKNITVISKELNELAEKARTKKITPVEMEGGNFTISNLGGIGGTNFTPIVYPTQVAILGVSRGSNEGVYVNDKLESRFILPLALTYDHRIIDGADAARFLRWVCEALENPFSMMI